MQSYGAYMNYSVECSSKGATHHTELGAMEINKNGKEKKNTPIFKKKYTANGKLGSAYRCVDIDMIFDIARFESVGGVICEPR